jgi:hypothetical protein
MPKFKKNTGFKMAGYSAFDKEKEPTDEDKAEAAKKGLSWNADKKMYEKVWKGDK